MKVLIVAEQPEESLINDGNRVKDLPAGLKVLLTESLGDMIEAKSIFAFFDNGNLLGNTVIELLTKNVLLTNANGFQRGAKEKLTEALELLNWYFSPRTRPCEGEPDGFEYCIDCGSYWPPDESECIQPTCPSHAKKRLAMDKPS